MTNECDLDEVRHIAQQKFVELVDSGVEWKKSEFLGEVFFRFGPWTVTNLMGHFGISLREEVVFSQFQPMRPKLEVMILGKDGVAKPKRTKERKEYEKAIREFEATPVVDAILRIDKVHKERECEARRKRAEDAMRESCRALQEALEIGSSAPQLEEERPPMNRFISRIMRTLRIK
jgi:hypothetical protein